MDRPDVCFPSEGDEGLVDPLLEDVGLALVRKGTEAALEARATAQGLLHHRLFDGAHLCESHAVRRQHACEDRRDS